jgi:hypothetical protein
MSSTHEAPVSYQRVTEPSNRSFGLTVGGILVAIAAIRGFWVGELGTLALVLLLLGVPLIALALFAPGALTLPNRAWMRLGVVLAMIVNPIILFLVFAVTITPTAIIRRLLGKDSLARDMSPDARTYWHDRAPPTDPKRMKNQF